MKKLDFYRYLDKKSLGCICTPDKTKCIIPYVRVYNKCLSRLRYIIYKDIKYEKH